MPTIKDIAREAGVSHGTVSNVLNKTGKVSIEKIRLVEAAAAKLGYVPNTQAQQLRQGSKKLIAIILPSLKISYYLDLYVSIKELLTSCDFEVSLYTTNDIPIYEKQALEQLPWSRIDAVITISCLDEAAPYYRSSCPIIFVNRKPACSYANTAFFSFDFLKAGREIGSYLQRHGARHTAYFSGTKRYSSNRLIYDGLCSVLETSGSEISKYSSDLSLASNKAFDLLFEDPSFDYIVAANAEQAEALLYACRFCIPDRRPEIITLDGFKTFSNNHFTAYELNYKLMGHTIAKKLLSHLQDGTALDPVTEIPNDGFRFQFPNLVYKENRTLNMLTIQSPSTGALLRMRPHFKELTGIDMQISVLPYEDLYEQIKLTCQSSYYDLIRMDVAWMSGLGDATYLPLEPYENELQCILDSLVSGTRPYYTHASRFCSLPFDPSVLICLYRKDLFEDALLKRTYYEMYHENLEIPNTFEKYNQVAAFFTQSINPASPTRYGCTQTYGSAAVAACDFMPRLLCFTDDLTDSDGNIQIMTPQALKALELYLELKPCTSGRESQWWGDSVREFTSGSTAMTITFSNHASDTINSKYSNVVGKLGQAIVPGGHPMLGGGIIGIAKRSKKVQECLEFFKWYYHPDVSGAITLLGGLSPNKAIYKNQDATSLFPWLSESRSSFTIGTRKISPNMSPKFDLKKFEYILGSAVKNAANGTMSPKQALEYAQSLYDIQFNKKTAD